MVKLSLLGALASLSIGLANGQQSWLPGGLVKGALTRFGINSTILNAALGTEHERPPAPHVVDLTDSNWETVLRTGGEDPFGKSLADDTTWVITVYGPDGVSNVMLGASDSVAGFNSTQAGGNLPGNMRFARLDYAAVTELPTLLWLWRVPAIVIATNNLNEFRFFKIQHIIPNQHGLAQLLSNQTLWETMPIWEGALAPGGKFSPYMPAVARGWAKFHHQLSRIPTFVILMASGAIMNFLIGLLHQGSDKDDVPSKAAGEKETAAIATGGPTGEGGAGEVGLAEKKEL